MTDPFRLSRWVLAAWLLLLVTTGAAAAADTAAAAAAAPVPAEQAGAARIVHCAPVAPDILALTIRAQRVEHGRQVRYTPAADDRVEEHGQHLWVMRGGKFLGTLVGKDRGLLWTADRLEGKPLDTAWAERPTSYRLSSPDDNGYKGGKRPEAVYRKTRPTDLAQIGQWRFEAPQEHTIFLRLPRPLQIGRRYNLTFGKKTFSRQSFVYNPRAMRSEAVHISHVGFRPDDPAKVAFLSCWMGTGGALRYAEGTRFLVLDARTGMMVHDGKVSLSKSADAAEDAGKRNYNGVDVYRMDFSELRRPGIFRIYVEGVGCSYPFPIRSEVWNDAFGVAARGFYHQRSGIALGPPYTKYVRPRPFHPEDGVRVRASTTTLMDTKNGLRTTAADNFKELIAGATQQTVPDAWGGYMDAGDWDRRIQHLSVPRLLLDLYTLFPAYFDELSLNIPESGKDGLPDILHEALFGLDFYRRLQTESGGIRGGIESSEHPRLGEASWQESLNVFAYAPDVWSSYLYAGVAARAALTLQTRVPERAAQYRDSALRAMTWAEAELPKRADKKDPHEVADARNLAAAELYRLTGDDRWHQLFLQTTVFKDAAAPLALWQKHEQRDAAWVYARTTGRPIEAAVKANAEAALRREADDRATTANTTGFHWTKDANAPAGFGRLTVPDAISLVRAHALTGEERYLHAALLACQTGLGANPLNLSYTTGLGHRSPENPLHIDSRVSNQPPPPGLTVYGPLDAQLNADADFRKVVEPFVFPAIADWPTMESYWDVFWYPPITEYTVHETHRIHKRKVHLLRLVLSLITMTLLAAGKLHTLISLLFLLRGANRFVGVPVGTSLGYCSHAETMAAPLALILSMVTFLMPLIFRRLYEHIKKRR